LVKLAQVKQKPSDDSHRRRF